MLLTGTENFGGCTNDVMAVGGTWSSDSTWSSAAVQSRVFRLTDHLHVQNGGTLTILPGTQVQCGGFMVYVDAWCNYGYCYYGHLVATGASFTSSASTLMQVNSSCTAALTNCVLQGSGGGNAVVNYGGLALDGCTINGYTYPVYWSGGGSTLLSGGNNFGTCSSDVVAVGGTWSSDSTWSSAAVQGRVFRLTDHLHVQNGGTLTILPGTQVQCGGFMVYVDAWCNYGYCYYGHLVATGASFTSSASTLMQVNSSCTAALTNCVLQGSGGGNAVVNYGGLALDGCTINGYTYPVYWSGGGSMLLTGTENFGGCTNDVMAVGGTWSSDSTWSSAAVQSRVFRLTDHLHVQNGGTLTILPGTQVQCGGFMVYVDAWCNYGYCYYGHLVATGASFTSSASTLMQVNSSCTAALTNCVLQGSGGGNAVVNYGGLALDGCTVLGFQTGVWVSATASGIVLVRCNIYGNSSFGVYNAGTNAVAAGNCWWGSPTGPRHPSNPSGRGDTVSDYVNFSGWRTSPWTGTIYVCNVQAAQVAGTKLVNISYDLVNPIVAGGSPVVVMLGVSTNGGASFGTWAVSCSGDIGSGAAARSGRSIVWNAGSDYGGRLCSTMRVLVTAISGSAMAQGSSPIFSVNTRDIVTGAITGLVTGGGSPVAGAQVRVEALPFGTNTAGSGGFTLGGVPVGNGYVVTVAASNYVACRLTGVNVTTAGANLGIIDLAGAGGSYRVIGLLPEVNPDVTQVEEGGVAYRYYKVVKSDGSTGAGGIQISLRLGAADIPQSDISDIWAGSVAGVSDADGVLRVSVPAVYLTTTPRTVQLLQGGQVKGSFLAKRVPRKYDQVWKHKFGGGVSFKGAVVRAGVEAAYESEVRRHMLGAVVDSEEIARLRSVEGRAGLEVGSGVHLGPVAVGAKIGAGGFIEGEASTTYDLPYGSTDPGVNAMKLYVVAGDPLSAFAGPAKGLVDYVRAIYEREYMVGNLKEASGGLTMGGYTEADVGVGFGLGQAGEAKIGASGSAEVAAFSEYAIEYKDDGCPSPGQPVSHSIGMSGSAEASVNLGLYNPDPSRGGLGFQFFVGADGSYKSTVSKRSDLDYFHEVSVEQKCQLNYGMFLEGFAGVWRQL